MPDYMIKELNDKIAKLVAENKRKDAEIDELVEMVRENSDGVENLVKINKDLVRMNKELVEEDKKALEEDKKALKLSKDILKNFDRMSDIARMAIDDISELNATILRMRLYMAWLDKHPAYES